MITSQSSQSNYKSTISNTLGKYRGLRKVWRDGTFELKFVCSILFCNYLLGNPDFLIYFFGVSTIIIDTFSLIILFAV